VSKVDFLSRQGGSRLGKTVVATQMAIRPLPQRRDPPVARAGLAREPAPRQVGHDAGAARSVITHRGDHADPPCLGGMIRASLSGFLEGLASR
jgi:hypothetical protein